MKRYKNDSINCAEDIKSLCSSIINYFFDRNVKENTDNDNRKQHTHKVFFNQVYFNRYWISESQKNGYFYLEPGYFKVC